VPALQNVAGSCLDDRQCQECAKNVVQVIAKSLQRVEQERLDRERERKEKEMADKAAAKKENQKNKKNNKNEKKKNENGVKAEQNQPRQNQKKKDKSKQSKATKQSSGIIINFLQILKPKTFYFLRNFQSRPMCSLPNWNSNREKITTNANWVQAPNAMQVPYYFPYGILFGKVHMLTGQTLKYIK